MSATVVIIAGVVAAAVILTAVCIARAVLVWRDRRQGGQS